MRNNDYKNSQFSKKQCFSLQINNQRSMLRLQRLTLTILLMILLTGMESRTIEDSPHIIKLAIMGTNDLHGTAFPKSLYRKDNRQEYTYGGLIYMARLLNIIKQEYGDRAIYLDTGDQYQGGVQSGPQASKGQIIADFFNALDLKASALGNHEFDYGHQFLINYLNFKNSTSLSANLFSEDGEPNFLPKQKSSDIFELHGIKVGVVGLATTETPTTTSGFISHKFPKYQFHEYPELTIRQASALRQQGAEIIIVLAHFGNKCPWNKTYDIRSNTTKQQSCENDEVINFIEALPEGTVDGILCGHRHQFAHHWHKNVPFMGAIDGGFYFNVMYFYFDTITRKVVATEIEGPIPVCQRIFANTRTCEYHSSHDLLTAGPLTTWIFHEKQVHADETVNKLFEEKYVPQMQKFTRKLVQNQIMLDRVKHRENSLANLITSMMIRAAQEKGHQIDFSIINHGAFRSTWFPGIIQDQHFYSMFPFENFLAVFQIEGAHLKQMLKRVQNGWNGFYFVDGVFQKLSLTKIESEQDPSQFYYKKGFIGASMLNGEQIIDDKVYKGVTVEFLLQGGDDFIKAFGQYYNPETKRNFDKLKIYNVQRIGEQRQQLHQQLKKLKVIREEQWEVQDSRRRIQIVELP